LLPALLLLFAVILLPAGIGAYHSFTEWNPGYESPWVGLGNYQDLFESEIFHEILANQAFLLLVIPLSVGCALLLSLLLFQGARGAGVFRTIFFLPVVLPPAVGGVAFTFLLAPDGPFNAALRALGLDGLAHLWLTEEHLVKPVLVVILSWSTVGTGIAILSASLSSLPEELFEAARLDGAGWWQTHWHVTRPLLAPAVELYAVLQVIQIFLWSFPWIYVLTAGGPGYSSTTLDWDVYQNTLTFGRFGLGAAEAVVILLLVGLVLLVASILGRWRRAWQG
jgi:ABC-type sugar transport system permease subunit